MSCLGCKHWDRDGVTYEWHNDYGEVTDERRVCKAVPFFLSDKTRTALAVVTDGSGYTGKLWTAPDFGCVLREALTEIPQDSDGRDDT